MSRKVLVAGLDGSLRNFGSVKVLLDIDTLDLEVVAMDLFKTEKSQVKKVRASSDNLERAQSIATELRNALTDCKVAFLEVPSGGQSYSAVLGFGIVIGLYASLTVPVCEVSPSETKLATVGTKTASKQEMIEWGMTNYPNAPWRTRKSKGQIIPTNDNEHLADALAIIHAGIKTPAFQTTLSLLRTIYGPVAVAA